LAGAWAAMTWLASQTAAIANQGIGAIGIAGFVLLCLLAFAARALLPVFLYFRPRTSATLVPTEATVGSAPLARPPADYESQLHAIDKTAFILSNAEIDRIYRSRVASALAKLPPEDGPRSDAEVDIATDKLQRFIDEVSESLRGSAWAEALNRGINDAGRQADNQLLQNNGPEGFSPLRFRKYYVAYRQVAYLRTFLREAATQAKIEEQITLQNVRERMLHHSTNATNPRD
jgi:hypothetical protein